MATVLTKKQAKAMALIKDRVPPTVAMRRAGYTPKTSEAPSQNLLRSPNVQKIIEQYKDAYYQVGIVPTYMAEKTKEWLEATKIKSSMTEPDKVVPDYETQLKAAEMVRQDWAMSKDSVTILQQFNSEEMKIEFIK